MPDLSSSLYFSVRWLFAVSLFSLTFSLFLVPPYLPASISFAENNLTQHAASAITPEFREKFFLLLLLVGGLIMPLISLLATVNARMYLTDALYFSIAALMGYWTIGHVVGDTAGALTALFLYSVVLGIGFLLRKRFSEFGPVVSVQIPERFLEQGDVQKFSVEVLLVFAFFALLAFPESSLRTAASIGYDMHIASFITAPAVEYRFGDKVPGVDFVTQYGIGYGPLFALFIGGDGATTVVNYVLFMSSFLALFFTSAFAFLRILFNSSSLAIVIALTAFFLQFHTDRAFYDPSSFITRYPLLILNIWLVCICVCKPSHIIPHIFLALSLAVSIFLNTETGILQLASSGIILFCAQKHMVSRVLKPVMLANGTALLFICLAALLYGTGVFSRAFIIGLFEPFLWYSSGFGAWPINWEFGWEFLYNFLSPALCLVAYALTTRCLILDECTSIKARFFCAGIGSFSVLSLLLTIKYWNMSISALWFVNSLSFLVIFAFWINISIRFWPHGISNWSESYSSNSQKLKRDFFYQNSKWLQFFNKQKVFLLFVLVFVANDERNPSDYGMSAYLNYRSFGNSVFSNKPPSCSEGACVFPNIHKTDIELLSKVKKQYALTPLLHNYDWAFHIKNKSTSYFTFMPSAVLFTRDMIDHAKTAKILIVPRDNLNVTTELRNYIDADFIPSSVSCGLSRNLVCWQKLTD